MARVNQLLILPLVAICLIGCSRGPNRVKPPHIDPESAADDAIGLYDSNRNGSLDAAELAKCPGILLERKAYDADANDSISCDEIAARIRKLRKHGIGLTRLNCDVTVNGRGLDDASVEFEPEPYLGDEIKTALGVTNERGIAQMAIPDAELPADQRGLNAIHYGTYKVRITHPKLKLPAKYNTETTLGYESRPGDPYATFSLKVP
ncbi:MAG: hypothetical protein WD738_23305 [Pirellulales bacterium]